MTLKAWVVRLVNTRDSGRNITINSGLVRLLLIVLVLLSLGLHLWRIEDKGIWWDESLSLRRAQGSIPYILSGHLDFPGISTIDQHPPLYFLMLHLLIRVCGESDLVLRFPSAVFATLLVPLLYVMGVRLRGRGAGLFAALLGALSPLYLWHAQDARMYTMVTALGLASYYCLWRTFADQDRRWAWGVGLGLLVSAAALTQYLFLLIAAAEVLLGLLLWRRQGSRAGRTGSGRGPKFWHLCAIALPSIALPLLAYAAIRSVPTLRLSYTYVSLVRSLHNAFSAFSLGLSADFAETWGLDVVFWSVFVLGVISIWVSGGASRTLVQAPVDDADRPVPHKARAIGLFGLLTYIFVPLLALWLFSLFMPIYMPSRYMVMCSPAFYLGVGIGLDAVARRSKPLSALLLLALVAGMSISLYRYYFNERYQVKEGYREAAQYITDNERAGDVIIVTGPESESAFAHYYQGDIPYIILPQNGPDPASMIQDIEAAIHSGDRIWFFRGNTELSDPHDELSKWLGDHAELLQRRKDFKPGFGSTVSVSAYLPVSPILDRVPAIATPLGTFEERLTLLDYAVRYLNEEKQAKIVTAAEFARSAKDNPASAVGEAIPDDQIVSTVLIWQTIAALRDYKTSLRLVDARGITWAQRDEAPFAFRPTSQWPIGSAVRQETGVRIAEGTPPGVYHLQLVVYEAPNGNPLEFRSSTTRTKQNILDLGAVAVIPALQPSVQHSLVPKGLTRPTLGASWGGVELLGYRLGSSTVKADQPLRMELYWYALKAWREDYDVVFTWQDAPGKTWRAPACSLTGNDYQTSHWRPGQMVRGLLVVPVPEGAPAGTYQVSLAVHVQGKPDPLWLRRGAFPWAGHNLQLGELVVK